MIFYSPRSFISITRWHEPLLSPRGPVSLYRVWPAWLFPRESADKLPPHQQLAACLVAWRTERRATASPTRARGPGSRNLQTEGFSQPNTLKGKCYSTVNPSRKVKPRRFRGPPEREPEKSYRNYKGVIVSASAACVLLGVSG